jgi:hypothetical protein
MKKPKRTVAERTHALASAFPKHPNQDRFLDAVIAARAKDLVAACPTLSDDQATATASAEVEAALGAVFYLPTESRFYFVWSSTAQARLLIHYTQTVWTEAPGEYGDHQPVHYEAKRPTRPSNKN